MDYKKRYLKYKLKYLILKKTFIGSIGGGEEEQNSSHNYLTEEEKNLGLSNNVPFGQSYIKLQIFDDDSDSYRIAYMIEKKKSADMFVNLKDKYTITHNATTKCNASGRNIKVYTLHINPPSPPASSVKPPYHQRIND